MKKVQMILVVVIALGIMATETWAQESDSDEFTLEEITVTAEKREVSVQKLASSVTVLEGENILQQGKITTQQILEAIPNVKFEGGTAANPNGGIAIRGLKYKSTSDGQPPSATATYVDGVFQGIGGNYDIERVEVLRGPQGTLYGRSATGGVVSFHTKDPKLSKFGASASIEVGEADLKNIQAALNAPFGDKFALRAAAHFNERDGYYNPDGGYSKTSEGRVKALWEPTDKLSVVLSGSLTDQKSASGGYTARLTSPGTIDFKDSYSDVVKSGRKRATMGALTVNYDFSGSTLTYIGAYRTYKDADSPPGVDHKPGVQTMYNLRQNFGENFHTEELRLASNSDGRLKWQIGANYYESDYERSEYSLQHAAFIQDQDGIEDPDPATVDAPIFDHPVSGGTINYGLFTEETYEFRDDFRVTAGLRFDWTEVDVLSAWLFNFNINEHGNSLNPPDWRNYDLNENIKFDNLTYKLRFEYDLSPNNMLYALTATGFQPGDLQLATQLVYTGPPGTPPSNVLFTPMPYEEEKLTSYEVGIKNRFLNNQLQVNVSAFYYDYEGYRHTVNVNVGSPAPSYVQISTPLEMKGAELSADWLFTSVDMLSFSAGYLDAKITSFPIIEGLVHEDTHYYMAFDRVPGVPEFSANLSYNHTFNMTNGSTLVPRIGFRYTGEMNISQITQPQLYPDLDPDDAYNDSLGPYVHQDSYIVTDIGTTWMSPSSMYSVTGYVRNLFDEEYVTSINTGGATIDNLTASAGDPRAWGLVLNVKY